MPSIRIEFSKVTMLGSGIILAVLSMLANYALMEPDERHKAGNRSRDSKRKSQDEATRDGVGFAIALGLLWMFGLWFVMSF